MTEENYEIVIPKEEDGYRVYSKDYELDEHIFFHGTNLENCKKIIKDGFIKGVESKGTSFSKTSPIAVKYACDARALNNPAVVMAVRFKKLDDLAPSGDCVDFYKHDLYQPEILGLKIISDGYPP